MLEETEGEIKNEQSKDTGNIGYTKDLYRNLLFKSLGTQDKTNKTKKHDTICDGHHYTQTRTKPNN
jgi:hypothetical protein